MPTRSEIQVLLVDLLEIYNAHRDKEREAKETYAFKKRDRIEGELARSDHLASYEHHMKENGRGSCRVQKTTTKCPPLHQQQEWK
jgi:hypothetical protein